MVAANALRTPDDRFAELPDFRFRPTMWTTCPGMKGFARIT